MLKYQELKSRLDCLNNREIILIIGASSSIGQEFIKTLDLSKISVVAHYNSREILKQEGVFPIKANLESELEVLHLINYIKTNHLIPNKIVHIASNQLILKHFKKMEWEEFQGILNIQIKSFMMIVKEFLPMMSKKNNSKVVTILSSVVFSKPPAHMANYVTAKYALLGLTKALASEYPKISINSISPSMMDTSFINSIPDKILEIEANLNPLKRNVAVIDVIKSIKFLLDDGSSFITGHNLPITGGAIFS